MFTFSTSIKNANKADCLKKHLETHKTILTVELFDEKPSEN